MNPSYNHDTMNKTNYLKTIRNVSLVACTIMGTACVNHIDEEIREGTVPISFTAQVSKTTTKATATAFEKGERTGLFAMLSPAGVNSYRYIDNLRLECGDNATLIPQKEVFYPEGDATLDFISYYPYQAEGIASEESRLPISVRTDQRSLRQHAASDFMVAYKTDVQSSTEPVKLTYEHQFTKLNIILSPQKGESAEAILQANPEIVAIGFYTQAIYDLNTQNITEEKAVADIYPFGKWEKAADGTVTGKEFIVIPQANADDEQGFVLEWNGKLYTCPMPSVTLKGNTEIEIRIKAQQNTSNMLSGAVGSITPWLNQEEGESENSYSLTSIHTNALTFSTSNVYRIYHQSIPVAEVCKEYLHAPADNIRSQAIVVYPVQNEQTDLQRGTILHFLDETAHVHGGSICWDSDNNSFTCTPGTVAPIELFYIDENGNIALDKPSRPSPVNVSHYQLRDFRYGILTNYPIVKIGTQYWMREDLQTTYYQDGTPLTRKTHLGTGAGYLIGIDDIIFYNGEALQEGVIAPDGWKIPNLEEWNKLITYLDSDAALIKTGTWQSTSDVPVSPINNLSELSIPANGLFNTGNTHLNHGSSAAYWISGEEEKTVAEKAVLLMGNRDIIDPDRSNKVKDADHYMALSIRCIKE